jgi:hypothetical protein
MGVLLLRLSERRGAVPLGIGDGQNKRIYANLIVPNPPKNNGLLADGLLPIRTKVCSNCTAWL